MKAHKWPWHAICCPGPKLSPDGMLPTKSMTPLRVPPSWPMVHKALPRQLIPRAVTEDTPHVKERTALARILQRSGDAMDIKRVVKMGEMTGGVVIGLIGWHCWVQLYRK